MANELMSQGLNLMIVGMGVVFVFLALLVIATGIMSKVVQNYFPDPVSVPTGRGISPETPSDIPDPRILAVIKAAVAEHRKNNH